MSRRKNASSYLLIIVLVALMFVLTVPRTGLCDESGAAEKQIAVATVNGSIVSEADIAPLVAVQLQKLREQEYDVKSSALERLIATKILEAEAGKKGIPVDQLKEEIGRKVAEPSDAEAEAYYLAQKDRWRRPFSDVQPQLRQALRQARIQQALEDYVAQLRERATIVVLLDPPRVQVADDPNRVRGNANAPVVIVEFSDFHCPYCKRVQATLDAIMSRYEGKVRISFRDMPIDGLHPRARAAAEAAKCAQDQGKFWEYHDVLFAQAPKASNEDLKQFAKDLGLDEENFGRCLFASKHHEAVQHDIDEGRKLGVTGTPAFFVNGRFVNGAQPMEKFVQMIEEELARQPAKVSAANP